MNKDTEKGSGVKSEISPADGKPMLYDALISKLCEMEIAAEEMEKAAWIAGAENTAMTSNGAKIAYRAVIGLIEKGIV